MTGLHLSRRWRIVLGLLIVLLIVAGLLVYLLPDGAGMLLGRRDATWAEMQRRGTLRVGMDPSFPPFETLNDAGAPVGYDVDLAHALAQQWGVQAEIVAIGFDSLTDAVMAGRVDVVISAMPYDERLTRDVTYSIPYFEAGIRLAVPVASPITNTAQLIDQRVAVEWGSTGDMIARRLQREEQIALEIVQFDTAADALAATALVTDASMTTTATATVDAVVDAVLVDQISLRIAQGAGARLVAVDEVLESSPYVIVSPRRANTLAAAINSALAALDADGTLQQLEERWFGSIPEN